MPAVVGSKLVDHQTWLITIGTRDSNENRRIQCNFTK